MEDEKFERCAWCGDEYESDELRTFEDEEETVRVCDDCYYEHEGYLRCDSCDMLYPEDEITYEDFSYDEVTEDGYYCHDCLEEKLSEIRQLGRISLNDLPKKDGFFVMVENAMENMVDRSLLDDEDEPIGLVS